MCCPSLVWGLVLLVALLWLLAVDKNWVLYFWNKVSVWKMLEKPRDIPHRQLLCVGSLGEWIASLVPLGPLIEVTPLCRFRLCPSLTYFTLYKVSGWLGTHAALLVPP